MTKKTHSPSPPFIFKFRRLATDTRKEIRRITQGELAERIGSTQSAIANFEAGKNTNPKIDFVCSIADALGIGLELRLPLRRSSFNKTKLPKPNIDLD